MFLGFAAREPFSSDHDGDGGLGDKVVGERAEEYATCNGMTAVSNERLDFPL